MKGWNKVKKYIKGESKEPPFMAVEQMLQGINERLGELTPELKKGKIIRWRRHNNLDRCR